MRWCDAAIIVGLRHHGETSVIVELLTRERGRHLGFVHGGRSRRMRPMLQPGNTVTATWQARTDEQLGTVTMEPLRLRAAGIIDTALGLQGVNLVCALVRLLPEREPQPGLHADADSILDRIGEPHATPGALVRFELTLLRELGFGLALDRCAATGSRDDLAFVSPKTGRAVCRTAGEPYRDRIFPLPAFLRSEDEPTDASDEDVVAGFTLTGYFLRRDVFAPRGLDLPDCRRAYIRAFETRELGSSCSRRPS